MTMGDEVAVRWTWRGTQQGPFLGIPLTGEAVVGSGIGLFRIANGRIVEDFVQEDTFGLLQQLGRSRRLGSQRAEAPSRNPAQGPSVVTVERATNLHRGNS
jgi:SnoaL-like polyketide cyclase